MRLLRKLVMFLLFLIIVLAVISFFLPSKAHVERSMVVDAPQRVVFKEVHELKNWEKWSPFSAADPTLKVAYNGTTVGIGGRYDWTSENSGEGYIEIKESNPPNSLKTYVAFEGQGDGYGSWRFEPMGDNRTKVTWGFDTEFGLNPLQRFMGLMMDRFLGPSYEDGLKRLKEVSEQAK